MTDVTMEAAVKEPNLPARPRRLNAMGQMIGWRSYLEVGVADGRTFVEIKCPRKVGVDPKFLFDTTARPSTEVFHTMTSDSYFSDPALYEVFDLVYLDGLHTYPQTLADLRNALDRTAAGSIILIDDVLPSDPFSAIPDLGKSRLFRRQYGNNPTSRAWHGDVYKVIVYIHDYLPDLSYATFNTGGNPQTVVWREPRASAVTYTLSRNEIDRLDFFWLMEHLQVLNPRPEGEVLARVRARFS
jgi:hypothetical protein